MLKRLVLAAVLATLPAVAVAQSAASSAPICDGSALRRAERARDVGRVLFIGTAAADLASMVTIPRNPGGVSQAPSHFRFVALTAPVALAGLVISQRAHPAESFWQGVIQRLTVGTTTTSDVRLCLHRPDVTSVSTTGQRWTYVIARPSTLGGSLRTLRLTFRDSVLADVERTEVKHVADARSPQDSIIGRLDRHHGFCAPPIPAVADPFPTPMDTTAAAAAMARAQADAEAASKNAAAFAAYASCMASDSAQ
jgi:hypothetical protein